MAALLWTVLSVLMLVQNSAAIDETELATIVSQLLNVYRPTYRVHGDTPTFTLAVSVPYNPRTRRYDVTQVTEADNAQNVRATLDSCQVYLGNKVMGAMVLKWPDVKNQCPNTPIPDTWTFVRELCPNVRTWADLGQVCTNNINRKLNKSPNGAVDHAEYRVLQSFNHFTNRLNSGQLNRNDLLVFYSYKAPCNTRCGSITNNLNIIQSIGSINTWPNHVLVFSEMFVPARTTDTEAQLETDRRTTLTNLGTAVNGLGNIYRCRFGVNRCSSCSAPTGAGAVSPADICVSNRSRSPSPIGK